LANEEENVDLFAVTALFIRLWIAGIDDLSNMDRELKDVKENKDANATEGLVARIPIDNEPQGDVY
jgi:hypothetical protein